VEPGFKSPAQESLDHKAQLVLLVDPVLVEFSSVLVVPSETANLRLTEFELPAVVEIL
jgi:hypothetical protein